MKTIKLEFLRHGPPNNHLLSPLTRYLAVCGDHEAETVTLPFEHAELRQLLEELRGSAAGAGAAGPKLRELGNVMGRILGQVPGLVADMGNEDGSGLTHLRLVLSANELALLPFELATSDKGLPGSGSALSLQTASPVCITREVRSAGKGGLWPSRFKILVAAAAPPGYPPVPLQAHLDVLRRAVDPWLGSVDPAEPMRGLGKLIEILPAARPRQLAETISKGGFTHVHLLAHGVSVQDGDDRRHQIALHHDDDGTRVDKVDAQRLTSLLRCRTSGGGRELATPTFVYLATCDSGNVGGVIGAGASLAHELHRAGIPLVIASQFPLSYLGSVVLAEHLYRPLFEGQDPRLVLDDVRRSLRVLVPGYPDWAGLVVYASLPLDLTEQLAGVRFESARRAIWAAMSRLDALAEDRSNVAADEKQLVTKEITKGDKDRQEKRTSEEARERFEQARKKLLELAEEAPERGAAIHGLLAGAEKRVADVLNRLEREAAQKPWIPHLRRAEACYTRTFEADTNSSWALMQALVLRTVLERKIDLKDVALVHALALRELRIRDEKEDRYAWALADLVELSLMWPSLRKDVPRSLREEWKDDPCAAMAGGTYALELRRVRPLDDWVIHSVRRQLARYVDGFLADESEDRQHQARSLYLILSGIKA